jgi:hypothetical protein
MLRTSDWSAAREQLECCALTAGKLRATSVSLSEVRLVDSINIPQRQFMITREVKSGDNYRSKVITDTSRFSEWFTRANGLGLAAFSNSHSHYVMS